MPAQTSIDRTTNITGNLSTVRGSPNQRQNHSLSIADPNHSKDLGGGNIFNFAPQTQRTQVAVEDGGTIGDNQQDSLNLPMESSRVDGGGQQLANPVNEYGEFASGAHPTPGPESV